MKYIKRYREKIEKYIDSQITASNEYLLIDSYMRRNGLLTKVKNQFLKENRLNFKIFEYVLNKSIEKNNWKILFEFDGLRIKLKQDLV